MQRKAFQEHLARTEAMTTRGVVDCGSRAKRVEKLLNIDLDEVEGSKLSHHELWKQLQAFVAPKTASVLISAVRRYHAYRKAT